jgi:ferritin
MFSAVVQDAVNDQINHEYQAAYLYLSMAAYCERQSLHGIGSWLRAQSVEEHGHAMRLYTFMIDWNAKVELKAISAPATEFGTMYELFQAVLKHEQSVTENIHQLYALAFEEKAYTVQTQLEWFLLEQVEEEKTARDLVNKLKLIGEDGPSLLDLDRELGERQQAEGPTEAPAA